MSAFYLCRKKRYNGKSSKEEKMDINGKVGITFFSASCIALSLFASAPVVSDVTMTQDEKNRQVLINYNLGEKKGIVTLDILTNGVSIGAANIQCIAGDVNKLVEPGARAISWRPDLA